MKLILLLYMLTILILVDEADNFWTVYFISIMKHMVLIQGHYNVALFYDCTEPFPLI